MKLNTIELDSFEASRLSVITNQLKHADFLQEFSILRQTYPLQNDEELHKLFMFLESAFKDVYSIEGDESAFLEIMILYNIILYVCDDFGEIYKNMEKTREILFNLAKCPLEIISVMQNFAGLLFEKDNIVESEKEYLMSMIHYFVVLSDPRGRGAYSSNYLLGLTWKSSMIAHYYKKLIDAELCEEMLDATLHNLTQSKVPVKDSKSASPSGGPSKKFSQLFNVAPVKNKFSKPQKLANRDSLSKINIDDIDVEILSNFRSETGDPFDDYKHNLQETRFLFYHWGVFKDKVEDIEDYMRFGAGNQLEYFIFLLRSNP